ncbi:hypothetical protein RB200_08735 [Streptomyces sp. PmtG]
MEAAGVRDAPGPGRDAAAAPGKVRTPGRHAAAVRVIADDLNGRGYPVTWVVDRRLVSGGFPLQVVAKVSVVRVLNISLDPGDDEGADASLVWRVTMGRPSSVRWEQSAALRLGADSLDGEHVVREALRALGLPLQRVYHY